MAFSAYIVNANLKHLIKDNSQYHFLNLLLLQRSCVLKRNFTKVQHNLKLSFPKLILLSDPFIYPRHLSLLFILEHYEYIYYYCLNLKVASLVPYNVVLTFR